MFHIIFQSVPLLIGFRMEGHFKLRLQSLKLRLKSFKLHLQSLKLHLQSLKLRLQSLKLRLQSLKLRLQSHKAKNEVRNCVFIKWERGKGGGEFIMMMGNMREYGLYGFSYY